MCFLLIIYIPVIFYVIHSILMLHHLEIIIFYQLLKLDFYKFLFSIRILHLINFLLSSTLSLVDLFSVSIIPISIIILILLLIVAVLSIDTLYTFKYCYTFNIIISSNIWSSHSQQILANLLFFSGSFLLFTMCDLHT